MVGKFVCWYDVLLINDKLIFVRNSK